METNINGIKCTLPCKVVSLGLDMNCHHVVTESIIISIDESVDRMIIESEGIKILLHFSDIKDFYVDTKENRKMLQEKCDKEYKEYVQAVERSLRKTS